MFRGLYFFRNKIPLISSTENAHAFPDSLNTKYTRCTWCVAPSRIRSPYKLHWHWLGSWRESKKHIIHQISPTLRQPGCLLHSWGYVATISFEQVTSNLNPRATVSKLRLSLTDTAWSFLAKTAQLLDYSSETLKGKSPNYFKKHETEWRMWFAQLKMKVINFEI